MGRRWKGFGVHARKCLDCPEDPVGRNMYVKGSPFETSGRKRERAFEKVFLILEKTYTIMNRVSVDT